MKLELVTIKVWEWVWPSATATMVRTPYQFRQAQPNRFKIVNNRSRLGNFMKSQIFIVTAITCCVVARSNGQAQAPTKPLKEATTTMSEKEVWAKIAEHDQQVWASHLNWTRTVVSPAIPQSAEEKAAMFAKSEADAKQHGFASEAATRIARSDVQNISEGFVGHSILDVTFFKGLKKALLTTKSSNGESRDINYSDGVIEGHFDSNRGDDAPFDPWAGAISVDQTVAMNETVPRGNDVFVMLSPISRAFPRGKTKLEVLGDVIRLTDDGSQSQSSDVLRLNVSLQTGLPLSVENVNKTTGKVRYVTKVQKWKIIQGISVPEEIVSYFASLGSPENYQFKYELNSAKLNDAVDSNAILLPPGLEVTDWRIGEGKFVNYRIKDGKVPSDAEVAKLWGEQEQEPKAKPQMENYEGNGRAFPWHIISGVALILMGALLWRGGRKS